MYRWFSFNLVSIFNHSAQCGPDHLHREYSKCPKSLALSSLTEERKLLIFTDGRPSQSLLCLDRILVVQCRLLRSLWGRIDTPQRLIGHYIPQERVAWLIRIHSPSLSCLTYIQPSTACIFGIIIPAWIIEYRLFQSGFCLPQLSIAHVSIFFSLEPVRLVYS